jgi:hypothetical protein
MIPPMAAVLTRLICQAWKTMLLAALVAGVAELCGMEFGNA